uniref:Uncharacterized protein n=1 Tax=Arundo donax TaxID=35708 RepID=A0A0A9G221_ARUDO
MLYYTGCSFFLHHSAVCSIACLVSLDLWM